jgi:hypothetical protein
VSLVQNESTLWQEKIFLVGLCHEILPVNLKLNIINMELEVAFQKKRTELRNRDRQVCIILPELQQYCVVSEEAQMGWGINCV